MLLYNSETPVKHFEAQNMALGGHTTESVLSDDGRFVAILNNNRLMIRCKDTGVEILDILTNSNGSTFTYDKFKNNFDFRFKEYNGSVYLGVHYKSMSGSSILAKLKIYKCLTGSIALYKDINDTSNLTVQNGYGVETRSKLIDYANGFTFFNLSNPNTILSKDKWKTTHNFDSGNMEDGTRYDGKDVNVAARRIKSFTLNGVRSLDLNLKIYGLGHEQNYVSSSRDPEGLIGAIVNFYSELTGNLVHTIRAVDLYRRDEWLERPHWNGTEPAYNINAPVSTNGDLPEVCRAEIYVDVDNLHWSWSNQVGDDAETWDDGKTIDIIQLSGSWTKSPIETIFDSVATGSLELKKIGVNLTDGDNNRYISYSTIFSDNVFPQSAQNVTATATTMDYSTDFKINAIHFSENDFYTDRTKNNFFSLQIDFDCLSHRINRNGSDYATAVRHTRSVSSIGIFNINDSGSLDVVRQPQVFDAVSGSTKILGNSMIKTLNPSSIDHTTRAVQNIYSVYDSVNHTVHHLVDLGTERRKYSYNLHMENAAEIHLQDDLKNLSDSQNRKVIFSNYPTTSTLTNLVQTKQIKIGNDLFFYITNTNNSDRILFFNSTDFENVSSQTLFPKQDIAIFITKDEVGSSVSNTSINHVSNDGNDNFSIIFKTDSRNSESDIYTVGLDDYGIDFDNILSFGTASLVEKVGERIYMSMDYSVKRYPTLNLDIYTELDPRSDYTSRELFDVKSVNVFTDYFNSSNGNQYITSTFDQEITLYDLEAVSSFYGGNNYIFNVVNKFLNFQKTFVGQILFDLDPVESLEITNLVYNSCNFSFRNTIYNANANFYVYLFDESDNFQAEVTGCGLINGFTQSFIPSSFSRDNRDQNSLQVSLVGLIPSTKYKAVVIPFSNFLDLNGIISKTYDELVATGEPMSEVDFETIEIPRVNVNSTQRIGHDLEINIAGYDTDPWSKLKYTIHKKTKTWDPSTFKNDSYIDSDIIDSNFDGNNLNELITYRDVTDNLLVIQNIYHDEDVLLIFNFENIWRKELTFSNNVPVGTDFYLPIPFTIAETNDVNLNFYKYGLTELVINETKPNYADFVSTEFHPNFNFATFDVENVDIGDIVPLKNSNNLEINFKLEDIVFYRIHFMRHPITGEALLPDGYDEYHENYSVSSFLKSEEEFNFYKKNYLENGRIYSYFIEPILNLDRTSVDRNQMIWDLLRTPSDVNLDHIRNDFTLRELKYMPSSTITVKEVDSEKIVLTMPSEQEVLNVMNTTTDLSDSLQLRIQVFLNGTRISSNIKNLPDIVDKDITVDYLQPNTIYEVFVNVTTAFLDRDPLEAPTVSETVTVETYPAPLEHHNIALKNAKIIDNQTITFEFSDQSLKSLIELEANTLNLTTGVKTPFTNIDMKAGVAGEWIITMVSSTTLDDLMDNVYEFIFYNTVNSKKSNGISYITAIPKVLKLTENVVIGKIRSSSVELSLQNLGSNRYGDNVTYETISLQNLGTSIVDSSYTWNYATLSNQSDLFELPKLFYGLKVNSGYDIHCKSRWINEELIKFRFSDLIEVSNRYFPTFEYEISDPFVPAASADFETLYGEIFSPVFDRQNDSGAIDLETVLYYSGGTAWINVGIDDGTGNIDSTKPTGVIEIDPGTTYAKPVSIILNNVQNDSFNVVFKVYSDSGLATDITAQIDIPDFPSVTEIKRIAINLIEQRQVLALDGSFDNKYFFKGYCMPADSNFSIQSTGLDKGLNSQLNYVVYTEPFINENDITEDVKVIEFTLDNLGYGITYSTLDEIGEFGSQDEIKIFAKSNDNILWNDSYPLTLTPFRCRYPLLPAPNLYEQNNQIKDSITFKFRSVTDSFGYRCSVYFKPLGAMEYNTDSIITETINNFDQEGIITYIPDTDVLKSPDLGDYKLIVTTLNSENEPSENSVYSTKDIIIKYLNREVLVPDLITLLNTSDPYPIFSFNQDEDLGEDKRSDYIVMTTDMLLGTAQDQTNAFGWYEFDTSEFNIFRYFDVLVSGLNTFFYKGYNKTLGMFSEVKSLQIYYDANNPTSFIANDIYCNGFSGVDKDGTEEDFIDPARMLTIHDNYKIKKLSYIIYEETGGVVSSDGSNKNIFESITDENLTEIYIYIDYEGNVLRDGLYRVDFYVYGEGENKKLIKSSNLIINNKTLPIPKIKYLSQSII